MAVSNLAVLALSAAFLFGGVAADMGQDAVSPIRKVVTLIEEMKVQTEKDAKADLEAYDKYMCWCQTNEKAKTQAIADAEATIEELTAFIEESKAKEGQLKTEIGQLKTDIAEDTDALATAQETRSKENEEFKATEADLTETIGLLKEAVEILSKVQLLQESGEAPSKELLEQAHRTTEILMQVKAKHIASRPSFAGLMQKDLFDMLGALGGPKDAFMSKRKVALNQQGAMQPEISEEEAGMAARPNGQNGAAAGAKSYNSRSGKIFGLLSEMSEEMQRDLAEAQKTEATSEENFANLKAAKEGEIAAATEQMKAKEAELADTLNKMAKAKRDLEKTEDALAADTDFLANMKKDCQVEDENYKKRAEIRSQEIVALAETLKILTEDDARELFGKTVSFVQESSVSAQKAKLMDRASKRAMERIAEVARRHKNWALASLAVRVRLDAFTKIKEMMDKMLAELKKQQQEEYEKAEACKKDIDETEDSIKEKNNLKDDLDEKHKSLKNTLETLKTEIAELAKEEEDMKIALKQAGEQRKKENQIYQQSVMDQRATVNILNKALARLKSFYESTGFIQQPGQAVSAPPPKGKDYSKSAGAGGVLQLLQKIITEAEQEEIELQGDENSAQVNYGKFVQDTTASIEADRKAIEEKTAQVAEAETALSETEEAQMANNAEISKLDDLLKAIHVDCDFTLKYFDIRQQARQEEMDSITDAKAILSGADFGK